MRKIKVWVIHLSILPFFIMFYLFVIGFKKIRKTDPGRKPKLIWGPVPLINNKYWSNALKKQGYKSLTLMSMYYQAINKKEDFDLYTYELPYINRIPRLLVGFFLSYCSPYYSFLYAIAKFDIFHHHFHGGFLGDTPFWKFESQFIKRASCKTIITAYGGDFYRYSKINDTSLRHVLLSDYPFAAHNEEEIQKKVNYWVKNSDVIISGFQTEGLGRWDVLPHNMITIDVSLWKQKTQYSSANGRNRAVKIIHTPNHRNFKGTGFLIEAIEQLKRENLKIELILIEKKQNDEVRKIMQTADILFEQLFVGYALSAMEGMASGLPVLSNTTNPDYKVFRRFSYLNECPIVPVEVENLKSTLRILIKDPQLRKKLGQAGRKYVEKYHSNETAIYMFGKVYDKIWHGKEVDLINLFNPLVSEYNKSRPVIHPPLARFKNI